MIIEVIAGLGNHCARVFALASFILVLVFLWFFNPPEGHTVFLMGASLTRTQVNTLIGIVFGMGIGFTLIAMGTERLLGFIIRRGSDRG